VCVYASSPATPEDGPKFWGAEEDLTAFTEFIRAYLIKFNRWSSPLYLAGESYGTFRAAGLASTALNTAGIAFQGILLISSVHAKTALFPTLYSY
jgi:carboxypeptidase C (cathepsin A)